MTTKENNKIRFQVLLKALIAGRKLFNSTTKL